MLKVKTLPVGQLATNCHLVYDSSTRETFIVDPGDDADYISRVIGDLELIPKKIIATHGHFDHLLAVNELKVTYNIQFLIHEKDVPLANKMDGSSKFFLGIDTGPPPLADIFLEPQKAVTLSRNKLEVILTPGHTPGGVSLYCKQAEIVFVGDTIFAGGGVGRTDFKYADEALLKKSIQKLIKLPDNTVVYSGHGANTTIGKFKTFLL